MRAIIFLITLLAINIHPQDSIKLTSDIFGTIEARHIGPAVMSGRISALDAVNTDPRTVYVGAAAGGIWKSTNAGTTFKPVFDKHNQSIGSITIDQNHPNTIWAGTGECWVRNSVSVGDGIYKSTDGGSSWKNMGLMQSERISKIIINPQNSDIVYAAVMGHLWNSNDERGVYKSTDGGTTWDKILFVNDLTGCADLAIDNKNPDILYAAMWEYYRKPYTFKSGGEGSGLFKSEDGGKSWKKLSKDLPAGELGRIAVAVSPVNSDIVYACIESEKSGICRSTDKGENWQLMSTAGVAGERPFYFSLLIADPVDSNKIFKPGFTINVSNDGGKSFTYPFVEGGNVHSDIHALWINPADNKFMYVGTDGGVYVSEDRGSTWRFIENLPVSQFYRVYVDLKKPYNVYGGLQDNGSWMGPSRSAGGITNSKWKNVGYGDGFNVIPDKTDDDILYWQYQGGNLHRYYSKTLEIKEIKPYSDNANEKLRFNWNTPVVFSPVNDVMYVGAQYLFRSTDKGDSWQKISPDLTTNNPGKLQQEKSGGLTVDNSTAENHCTIITISESALDENIIWAGTDDGNLQVTKNGGKSWTNLAGNISSLPEETWCSYVEASRFNNETAYAAFDGHRSGDMKTYIFKTTDLGKTWISIASEDIKGFCHVIKEDFKNPGLLFLGTESGLFVSINGGNSWVQFTGNLPNAPVFDMILHPAEDDLVLATHGRGIIIIDNISPLRELTPEVLNSELTILSSPSYIITNPKITQAFAGDQGFVGRNPSEAAVITYYMNKRHVSGDMNIEIYDSNGEKIQVLPAGKRKGINRAQWYIRRKPPKVKASSPMLLARTAFGPTYPPGEYTVKILKGDKTYSGKINLINDPASTYSSEDRKVQYSNLVKAYDLLEMLELLDTRVTEILGKLKQTGEKLIDDKFKKELEELSGNLDKLHNELVATNPSRLSGEVRLREKISDIYGGILNYQGRPTKSQIEGLYLLEKEFLNKKTFFDLFIEKEIPAFNRRLKEQGFEEINISSLY